LQGSRSGSFWPFWRLIQELAKEGRAPSLVVLENVCGALTSHQGRDFGSLAGALAGADYRFGALVIDAVHFVPQSRPRLFVVAARKEMTAPAGLVREAAALVWSPPALLDAWRRLSPALQPSWLWWNLPLPQPRTAVLADLVEDDPAGVRWHSSAETKRLLEMMSPLHREKVRTAQGLRRRVVGTLYKRTRPAGDGARVQRAEVRFDGIAGCLRTPSGGSSRQFLMVVEGGEVRTRLISAREAARLMGLAGDYQLPDNYNEAYRLAGDGLAVPVVRHVAQHLLEPLLAGRAAREAA
jgi:DNA (cytosine-5)-methyltransferase 1